MKNWVFTTSQRIEKQHSSLPCEDFFGCFPFVPWNLVRCETHRQKLWLLGRIKNCLIWLAFVMNHEDFHFMFQK